MLRVARLLAAGLGVALAAWRCEQDVVCRHLLPARLVRLLADVLCARVVGAVAVVVLVSPWA